MLDSVALHEERNWFQLDSELNRLPKDHRQLVQGRIARDMGQRAGVAPLGYPVVAILLMLISADIREHLDWLWLPSLGMIVSGLGEFFMGRRLAVADDDAIAHPKKLYQLFCLTSALSWGMYAGLIILTHEGSPLSMLVFLCTVAATSISVGSQTQEKSHWLNFLTVMWTPIAASTAMVAGIHKESEVLLFAILAVVFPVLVGVQGLRLVAEYLEAQLDRSALENRSLELEEALIKQQLAEKANKAMEVQLRHAQKLESIGQLAAGIAHEINTPIQFVGDNTRFLQEAYDDIGNLRRAERALMEQASDGKVSVEQLAVLENEYDLEYLMEEIPKSLVQSKEGLSRIANIVLAMKEFSHPGSREKEQVNINRAIQTTIEVSRNEWKYVADIDCQLAEDLPLVPGYSQDLNQVFLNMIVNAAHAIKEKNQAVNEVRGLIRISTRSQVDCIEIVIGDNGSGIAEALITKVFDPFFTTKAVGKGSGQGLAIAYSVIVDKHAGKINVDSKPGAGTTFTMQLPLLDKNEGSMR